VDSGPTPAGAGGTAEASTAPANPLALRAAVRTAAVLLAGELQLAFLAATLLVYRLVAEGMLTGARVLPDELDGFELRLGWKGEQGALLRCLLLAHLIEPAEEGGFAVTLPWPEST
jgi:hypothetical protein